MFGPINDIQKTTVIMGKNKIEFFGPESPLHAVDACFKATIVLKQEFPIAATRPWEFLQRRVCRMPTKTNTKAVTDLSTALDNVAAQMKQAYPRR